MAAWNPYLGNNMKKTTIAILSLILAFNATAEEYNPFIPEIKEVPATNQEIEASKDTPITATEAEAIPQNKARIEDMVVDEELKALLKKLEEGNSVKRPQSVEYVATANCVDIFYHTNTKTYEERTSKECIKSEARKKIKEEINNIEKNRGKNVQ